MCKAQRWKRAPLKAAPLSHTRSPLPPAHPREVVANSDKQVLESQSDVRTSEAYRLLG